jgi:hypothetical protein
VKPGVLHKSVAQHCASRLQNRKLCAGGKKVRSLTGWWPPPATQKMSSTNRATFWTSTLYVGQSGRVIGGRCHHDCSIPYQVFYTLAVTMATHVAAVAEEVDSEETSAHPGCFTVCWKPILIGVAAPYAVLMSTRVLKEDLASCFIVANHKPLA